MIGACILSFAFGFYFNAIAMSKIIKGNLFSISKIIDANLINEQLTLKQFAEFIELHSFVKQLSWIHAIEPVLNSYQIFLSFRFSLISDFTDIFQGVLTILFMWSLITVCGALLMVQVQTV